MGRLLEAGVEAIGVCLLWSFADPSAERAVAGGRPTLRPDVFLTLSHEVAPIVGEYERTSTVALNARLDPSSAATSSTSGSGSLTRASRANYSSHRRTGGCYPSRKLRNGPWG